MKVNGSQHFVKLLLLVFGILALVSGKSTEQKGGLKEHYRFKSSGKPIKVLPSAGSRSKEYSAPSEKLTIVSTITVSTSAVSTSTSATQTGLRATETAKSNYICDSLGDECSFGRYSALISSAHGHEDQEPDKTSTAFKKGYKLGQAHYVKNATAQSANNDEEYIAGYRYGKFNFTVIATLDDFPSPKSGLHSADSKFLNQESAKFRAAFWDGLGDRVLKTQELINDEECYAWEPLTEEVWEEWKVTDWLKEEESDYKGDNFTLHLKQKYAPTLDNSTFDCTREAGYTCAPFNCSYFETVPQNSSANDQRKAWYAFVKIANMANEHQDLWEANKNESLLDGIIESTYEDVHRFTQGENGQIDAIKRNHAEKSIFLNTFMGLIAFDFYFGLPDDQVNKTLESRAGIIDAVKDMPANYQSPPADFEGYFMWTSITNASAHMHDSLMQLMLNLTTQGHSFQRHASDNHITLSEMLTGRYATRRVNMYQHIQEVMRHEYMALQINLFWKSNRAYIAVADALTGGCRNDTRGNPDIRVCLPEYPDKSFWSYYIPRMHDIRLETQMLGPPPHFMQLKNKTDFYGGITVEDITRGSWQYWLSHKNTAYDRNDSWIGEFEISMSNYTTNHTNGRHEVNPYTAWKRKALFNIPVAYAPRGDTISSINTEKGMHYPCRTGVEDWTSESVEGEDSLNFLQATMLWKSRTWYHWCDDDGKSKAHCKQHWDDKESFVDNDGKVAEGHNRFYKCLKPASAEDRGWFMGNLTHDDIYK
ncbi:hypothetical protein BU16DRAFT_555591 [Lophium mytilinum]|uniref:Alginate lyase domain-containing protein n=1 Tax=Lophium mytilinum TaxID=390894 RepID=A0A6A6R8F7_9PEZI|nr:hypothetical protein BU16DRAFT_555591 [Lophium mytilinum]